MKKNNKLAKTALGGLLAVAVAGATFAWFTDQVDIHNKFKTGKYEDEVTENFTPPKDWAPGVETDKEVTVKNTGDVPMVARVKFSESWSNGQSKVFAVDGVNHEAAIKNLYDTYPNDRVAESITKSGQWYVVDKNEELDLPDDAPRSPKEAYYLSVLQPGESAVSVLDSVTMNSLIPTNDTTQVKFTYTAYRGETADAVTTTEYMNNVEWETFEKTLKQDDPTITKVVLESRTFKTTSKTAYSDAEYTLTITVETVQADANAIRETWGADTALNETEFNSYVSVVLGK